MYFRSIRLSKLTPHVSFYFLKCGYEAVSDDVWDSHQVSPRQRCWLTPAPTGRLSSRKMESSFCFRVGPWLCAQSWCRCSLLKGSECHQAGRISRLLQLRKLRSRDGSSLQATEQGIPEFGFEGHTGRGHPTTLDAHDTSALLTLPAQKPSDHNPTCGTLSKQCTDGEKDMLWVRHLLYVTQCGGHGEDDGGGT